MRSYAPCRGECESKVGENLVDLGAAVLIPVSSLTEVFGAPGNAGEVLEEPRLHGRAAEPVDGALES